MIDQIEAVDRLEEALLIHEGEHLPSMRALIEAMHECELIFAEGTQEETIVRMDELDAR